MVPDFANEYCGGSGEVDRGADSLGEQVMECRTGEAFMSAVRQPAPGGSECKRGEKGPGSFRRLIRRQVVEGGKVSW